MLDYQPVTFSKIKSELIAFFADLTIACTTFAGEFYRFLQLILFIMKKTVIALMCMILTTGAAMAQKTFTLGPKVGVDYTHFWGKETLHGGQLNYQAGLFMEYRFNNKFSIAPEIVFAAQGGKNDGFVGFDPEHPYTPYGTPYGEDFVDADYIYNMNYINIPVMLKYYVTSKLSIDFGPQLGFNVYHKCTIKGTNTDYKETVSLKDSAKSVDFGLGLGVTYNITENVLVQARYTLGLTDAIENKVEWGEKGKNGNAQIAIGFRF